jgi:hypothetical protein
MCFPTNKLKINISVRQSAVLNSKNTHPRIVLFFLFHSPQHRFAAINTSAAAEAPRVATNTGRHCRCHTNTSAASIPVTERKTCPTKERIARIVQINAVAYVLVIRYTRYAKNICKILKYFRTNLRKTGDEGSHIGEPECKWS